jgi:hypothetical protein
MVRWSNGGVVKWEAVRCEMRSTQFMAASSCLRPNEEVVKWRSGQMVKGSNGEAVKWETVRCEMRPTNCCLRSNGEVVKSRSVGDRLA